MIVKARENLECAKLLALDQYAYYDAVANRAYFAAYHAGWYYLVSLGYRVPKTQQGTYWPHRAISDTLEDAGAHPYENWDSDWDYLWNQRVKADYEVDEVSKNAARKVLQHAKQIIAWVGKNEAR
jgi:uncharacterized protein (UPF0332 family)